MCVWCMSDVCLMSLRFHAVVVHAPSMVVLSLMMPGSLGAQREGGVQEVWELKGKVGSR